MTLRHNKNKSACRWIVAQPISLSNNQSRILNAFFVCSVVGVIAAMLGIILYYVYAFAAKANGSYAFDWLLGIFSDYVTILNVSLFESPYVSGGASYPPLAIGILYPFALICKGVLTQYSGQEMDVDTLTSKVVQHPEFWVSIVLFFVICTSLVVFLVIKVFSLGRRASFKVTAIILFSAPFVFAIMRGNTIYFALIFLLVFLWLYDSNSAAAREMALFALAFAGLIKIYPLFFGVFLLRKKKIFASVRVAVYFFVLFVLSFFIYEAGLGNFSTFIHQLGDFATSNDRLLGPTNLSITSCLYKLLPAARGSAVFEWINVSLLAAVFMACAITATVTKSDFSRYVIAASVIVLIPSISYFYILIFAILPFVQFIREYDTLSIRRRRFFCAAFFFLLFTLSLLPGNFIVHALVVMAMMLIEVIGVVRREIVPYFARKKAI